MFSFSPRSTSKMSVKDSDSSTGQWKFEEVRFRHKSSQPLGKMEHAKFHIEERKLGRSNGYICHWILSKDSSSNGSRATPPSSKRKLYSTITKHERYTPYEHRLRYKPASEQIVYVPNIKAVDVSTQPDCNLYSRMFESLVGKEEALRIDEQYQQAKRKDRSRRSILSISDLCTNT